MLSSQFKSLVLYPQGRPIGGETDLLGPLTGQEDLHSLILRQNPTNHSAYGCAHRFFSIFLEWVDHEELQAWAAER